MTLVTQLTKTLFKTIIYTSINWFTEDVTSHQCIFCSLLFQMRNVDYNTFT